MKTQLYFKKSVSRGKVYMQIWKREKGREELILILGSPERCLKNSVRLRELERETENMKKYLTEISEGKYKEKTENKAIEVNPLL